MSREEEVRLIAHRIWEQEGCCDGHDCEHWLKAEMVWEDNQKNRAVPKQGQAKPLQSPQRTSKSRTAAKKR
jgi:hypothetical protein